jgi:hypothetical protein
MMDIKPEKRDHYISNKEFSIKVVEYVNSVNDAKKRGKDIPRITEYLGSCFLKISEGLSRRPNFIRYTYREEMVMDAVENCLKAIMNYNVNAPTRSGIPNAFSYFTQICFYAFLRRIAKEKRQQDIKARYIAHAGIEAFADFGEEGSDGGARPQSDGYSIVERVKSRTDSVQSASSTAAAKKKRPTTASLKVPSSVDMFSITT